ncbi:MAG: hypothetical protein WC274_03695 [Sulfurimonas sp.]|jgi:hypothetical protein
MPMILEHIDKIARDKKRDVLYIEFALGDMSSFKYKKFQKRNELLVWLNDNDIPYKMCGPIASEYGWSAYRGQLYIDLPMDETNEKYKLIDNHLTTEEDNFKIEGIEFYYLPLEVAMKNAHHDEPGFWDKWAEDF